MTIFDFLADRIGQDEATAADAQAAYDAEVKIPLALTPLLVHPDRLLAEASAKRRIFETHVGRHGMRMADERPAMVPNRCSVCLHVAWPCKTLVALVSVYAGHEGYDQTWSELT